MKASVKTAYQLDQKLTEDIKHQIEKYTGKNIELKSTVDARLIGGLIIHIEDRLFDASVSGKLLRLKNDLINTYISK